MSINIFICHFIFDALDRVSLFVNVGYLMVLMLSPAALKVGADPRQISDQLLSLSDLHLNTVNTRIVRFVCCLVLNSEFLILSGFPFNSNSKFWTTTISCQWKKGSPPTEQSRPNKVIDFQVLVGFVYLTELTPFAMFVIPIGVNKISTHIVELPKCIIVRRLPNVEFDLPTRICQRQL